MADLSTRLCEVLDLTYPLVQAPIGGLTNPELAAAVSNAGGLGTLALTWHDPESAAAEITATRDLTDRPFAVNLVLDEETTITSTADHLSACLAAGAPIVSFSFGDPEPYLEPCLEADVPTIATVGTAEMAKQVVDAGVDVVCAQGWEAGGHLQSEVATMALVPRVVDTVPATPVVAAGGIGDGRGVAACLALGAEGAWLGTRFVASDEALAHDSYKEAVTTAAETDTVRSRLYDGGWPGRDHRVLATALVDEWTDAGEPPPGERPGEGETVATHPAVGDVDRYDDIPPITGMAGDVEAMAQYAGQSAGVTDDVKPAAEIVADLVTETRAAAARVGQTVETHR